MRLAVISGLMLLVACGGGPDLPAPGAEQGGRVSWYAAGSQRPVLAEVRSLSLGGAGMDELVLHSLRVRIEDEAGTVWVTARGAEREPASAAGEVRFRLFPPITLQGQLGGHAVLGGAVRGTLEPDGRRLVLEEVEMLTRGQRSIAASVSLAQDAPWEWREQRSAPADPHWVGLMGVLPTSNPVGQVSPTPVRP